MFLIRCVLTNFTHPSRIACILKSEDDHTNAGNSQDLSCSHHQEAQQNWTSDWFKLHFFPIH